MSESKHPHREGRHFVWLRREMCVNWRWGTLSECRFARGGGPGWPVGREAQPRSAWPTCAAVAPLYLPLRDRIGLGRLPMLFLHTPSGVSGVWFCIATNLNFVSSFCDRSPAFVSETSDMCPLFDQLRVDTPPTPPDGDESAPAASKEPKAVQRSSRGVRFSSGVDLFFQIDPSDLW